MVFENGERVVTFQNNEQLTDREKEHIKKKFESYQSEELYDLVITKSTVNLLYNPILIMETRNTIEPSLVPMEAIKDIISEVEV